MKRTMHSAVNQPMQTASIILCEMGRVEREREREIWEEKHKEKEVMTGI